MLYSDLCIAADVQIYESNINIFVGGLIRGVLDTRMKQQLLFASKEMLQNIQKFTKSNKRGKAVQLHFGFWGKHVKKGTITETIHSKEQAAKMFYFKTHHIWEHISQIIKKLYPQQYNRLLRIKHFWKCSYTYGLWHTLAYNYQLKSEHHIDTYDDKFGICVVIPIGVFKRGYFTLNEFNIDLNCKFGDIVVASSALYRHQNQDIVGERDSIILFNCMYLTEHADIMM